MIHYFSERWYSIYTRFYQSKLRQVYRVDKRRVSGHVFNIRLPLTCLSKAKEEPNENKRLRGELASKLQITHGPVFNTGSARDGKSIIGSWWHWLKRFKPLYEGSARYWLGSCSRFCSAWQDHQQRWLATRSYKKLPELSSSWFVFFFPLHVLADNSGVRLYVVSAKSNILSATFFVNHEASCANSHRAQSNGAAQADGGVFVALRATGGLVRSIKCETSWRWLVVWIGTGAWQHPTIHSQLPVLRYPRQASVVAWATK